MKKRNAYPVTKATIKELLSRQDHIWNSALEAVEQAAEEAIWTYKKVAMDSLDDEIQVAYHHAAIALESLVASIHGFRREEK